jgi:hypothetical protein
MEWGVHKYILHGIGKNKKSMWNSWWSSHFHTHHRNCIRFVGGDPDYLTWSLSPEIKGLAALMIIHSPIFIISIPAYTSLAVYSLIYYYAHRKSHLDVEWGWKYIPWHMDHHLGARDKNWCVLLPLADYVLATREKSSKNPYCKSVKKEV